MTPALKRLIRSLEHWTEDLSLNSLIDRVDSCPLALDDVAEYIRFEPDHYARNPVHQTDAFEALVMCWSAGQSSPIHDHHGSFCAVRVLTGTMLERQFRQIDGELEPDEVVRYAPGCVCGSEDSDIHEIVNLDRKGDLVTLHVYAPPLNEVNVYELDGSCTRVGAGAVSAV